MPFLRSFAPVIMAVALAAGCSRPPNTGGSTFAEMEQTEANHRRLVQAVPAPQFTTSQERKNLVRRLETFNVENKLSYIYLIEFGRVIAFHVVKGKVSSLNSLLTTPQQVTTLRTWDGQWVQHVLPSPDFDGSYGNNPEGIFFYTPDGAYVEWNGRYHLSDRPLRLTQPSLLVAPPSP